MASMWSEEGEYLSNSPEFAPKKKSASHPTISAAQLKKMQIEQWAKKNPDNAAYDNDGNPTEKDK